MNPTVYPSKRPWGGSSRAPSEAPRRNEINPAVAGIRAFLGRFGFSQHPNRLLGSQVSNGLVHIIDIKGSDGDRRYPYSSGDSWPGHRTCIRTIPRLSHGHTVASQSWISRHADSFGYADFQRPILTVNWQLFCQRDTTQGSTDGR